MKKLIFALVLFSIYSCADIDKRKHLEAIEKMNKSLDSIQTVLLENEIDTIAALGVATNSVELRIKNNYDADTIDMELGRKMDAYKLMRRTLAPLGRSFYMIKTSVIEEKSTLEKLKTDIEKGNGERKKFPEYIKFEEAKVQQLRILLKEYVIKKNETMKTFHELHEVLDAFSMSLLNKKKKV